jgi:sortase A
VAWVLGGIGKTLIFVGLVILGFVGYTLIGTNWAESRHQNELRGQLQGVPEPAAIEASQPNDVAAPPAPPEGDAVAVIKIPRIGVEKAVVEGVALPLLKRGPGHYPGTPLPGQPGNAAIAGHRTTYGAPFFRLNEMQAGDPILVSTVQGQFLYEVREVKAVKPSAVEVLLPSGDNRLTLTTCHPRFSAAQRLVLIAELKGPAATSRPAPGTAIPPPRVIRDEVVGADGNPAKRVPTILWGLAVLVIVAAAIVAAKRWKRWAAYLIAAVPFLLCLWSFYANLAEVIPS